MGRRRRPASARPARAMTHRRTGISLRGLPSLPPVSCWPARSLMQAVDAFVHAMTTLWERLQPRGLGISIPKKLAAEAAPTGLPKGSRLHGLRRSGAAAERSEEHKSELQPLMRISYADLCLHKKK